MSNRKWQVTWKAPTRLPLVSGFGGSLCSQPEGFITSLSHRAKAAKAFFSAVKKGLIIENSDYNYVRSELNVPVKWSLLLWSETNDSDWFSTDLFWRIIQSLTGSISSLGVWGNRSIQFTVHPSYSLSTYRWSLRCRSDKHIQRDIPSAGLRIIFKLQKKCLAVTRSGSEGEDFRGRKWGGEKRHTRLLNKWGWREAVIA